jgi:hypothetical protein
MPEETTFVRCQRLKREASDLSSQAARKKEELASIQGKCRHVFGDVMYDPIRREAYRIPGDPPGVGGSDHRFSVDVPVRIIPRWEKTCNLCGLVKTTKRSQLSNENIPIF